MGEKFFAFTHDDRKSLRAKAQCTMTYRLRSKERSYCNYKPRSRNQQIMKSFSRLQMTTKVFYLTTTSLVLAE